MPGLRRSCEKSAYADIEGFAPEALVVRGPLGAVSYEDQRWNGGLGFREVYQHTPSTSEYADPCPRLDGVGCLPDSAVRSAVTRWESEGAFDSEESTFALLERLYVEWFDAVAAAGGAFPWGADLPARGVAKLLRAGATWGAA